MQQKIVSISGAPDFDSLNVIKLRCEKSVEINSRVFAQAQICRNEENLYVRILSFESQPESDSTAAALFWLGEKSLKLEVTFGGLTATTINGDLQFEGFTAYTLRGEDLQGEYWGTVMIVPLELLFDSLGISPDALPEAIGGNLFRYNPAFSAAALKGEQLEFLL
ncbi:MAG: hypothetical protein J5968_07245 [Oscillospiraceae bacterium]|nr:hypothetical protein [Oscillospiraceae bacterium]